MRLPAISLVVLLLASPSLAQPRAVERWLASADRAMARGREAQAIRLWRLAIRRAPEDGRAATLLAGRVPSEPERAIEARALAIEARDALDLYLSRAGDPPRQARLTRAWMAAVAGDVPAAIEAVVTLAGPEDEPATELLRRLAALAIAEGSLTQARRALISACGSMPQDPDALADLAAVELAMGRAESAADRFRRALARRPEDLDLARDLAGALLESGQAAEAVALLSALAGRADAPADLTLDLAQAALEAGDATRAEQAAEEGTQIATEHDGRAHALLGAALAALGRRRDAEAAFREALRRDPGEPRARSGLDALAHCARLLVRDARARALSSSG